MVFPSLYNGFNDVAKMPSFNLHCVTHSQDKLTYITYYIRSIYQFNCFSSRWKLKMALMAFCKRIKAVSLFTT